jgi:putative DNA primase/helicase
VPRRQVDIDGKAAHEIVREIRDTVIEANRETPRLFELADRIVTIVNDPARAMPLDLEPMWVRISEVCEVIKTQAVPGQRGVRAKAPTDIKPPWVSAILKEPQTHFPPLNRIVHVPFFAPSGRLVAQPGYDVETGTFYHINDAALRGLAVPRTPTQADVHDALAVISEVLVDFPFKTHADKTNALAYMLLPFARDIIEGPTPMHNFEASAPGSGKGLLFKATTWPSLGAEPSAYGVSGREEEWRKELTAQLRTSPQLIWYDNVPENRKLSSATLARALTEPVFAGRILGVSEDVSVPVRCVWAMTANNPSFSDELARRVIRIRLEPDADRPEERTGFRHPDLYAWVKQHRALLVRAALTLIQAWVAGGMLEGSVSIGSYERYAGVMSGILETCGITDFMGNRDEFMQDAGEEKADWRTLVAEWRDKWGVGTAVHSKDLAWLAVTMELDMHDGSRDDQAKSMGKKLGKRRGQRFNGLTIEKHPTKRSYWWLSDGVCAPSNEVADVQSAVLLGV